MKMMIYAKEYLRKKLKIIVMPEIKVRNVCKSHPIVGFVR